MVMKHPPSNLRKSYADTLKRLRETSGLNQEELARRMNAHKSFVSHVERAAQNITIETVQRYFDALFPPTQGERPQVSWKEAVGGRIRFVRERQDITREALAGATGFSIVFLMHLEFGETNTSLDRLDRIAEALSVDGRWLLTGENLDETPFIPLD